MTPDTFLNMTVEDILKMLKEDDSNFMEAKLVKEDGSGIMFRFSYESLEE
ncbi:Uncharacterised protein [Streptococcus acidominimus]|uniref:Uncharacterized protein n=1 Tax=Streptococcus acidominimus TaxID=1326 RepID=A0A239WZ85_STRAI|nr:hypothetical protein [Streptococcus acidominimus]SNV39805.1 Uncharacterised protein [Streptococcus acidominimus]